VSYRLCTTKLLRSNPEGYPQYLELLVERRAFSPAAFSKMRTATNSIVSVLSSAGHRVEKARKIAAFIRELGCYRWVGIYDVGPETVSIISYSGPAAPAYPEFPVTKGLTGSAIRDRKTVVVGDVRSDPRYLTAFGTTRSEIIIPVLDEKIGVVVGTIDVESQQINAFSKDDHRRLEECAMAARLLWTSL
jgi:L-methionine (R)-S-oxide reductase